MAYEMVLICEEITCFWQVADITVKWKSCKRQYIWNKGTLTVSKVVNLIAVKDGSYYDNGEKPVKRVCITRHCGRYGEKGYNSRIYIIEIKDIDDSDTFKE